MTELLLSAPESEGEMVHHHFLLSHPKNQSHSSINKPVNRCTHVRAQHWRRGVIARLDAAHLLAFSHSNKHDETKASDLIWLIPLALYCRLPLAKHPKCALHFLTAATGECWIERPDPVISFLFESIWIHLLNPFRHIAL